MAFELDAPIDSASAATLTRIVETHAALDHPHIAKLRVVERSVRLVVRAGSDEARSLVEILAAHAAEERPKLRYAAACALTLGLLDALQTAHGGREGSGPSPVYLGSFSAEDIVIEPDGDFAVFGFGGDAPRNARTGSARVVPPAVAAGASPRQIDDIHACAVVMRSLLHRVDVPGPIARVFARSGGPAERALGALFERGERLLFGFTATRSMNVAAECEGLLRRFWALVGVEPDARSLHAALADSWRAAEGAGRVRWLVFEPGEAIVRLSSGDEISLASRPALARIAEQLIVAHERGRGPVATEQLVAAGWPGERILPAAASNRLHVALSTLRRLGLGDLVVRDAGGYAIASGVEAALHVRH
jgi:hypothetical protein